MFSIIIEDLELLTKLKAGSNTAYEQLYTKYFSVLCRFVNSYTHNSTKSQDVVQQVMLKIWEQKTELSITHSLKSYLFRACYNEFLNQYRQTKRNTVLDDIVLNIYEEIMDEQQEFDEKLLRIKREIENLPPKCRQVFMMSKLQGYKYKEIAEELNISQKTVEIHISNAMKKLRSSIGE